MASTSVVSVKVAGWCSSLKVARRASNSDCDSVGRTRKAPARPWRVLFSAEAALPASLFGPVENLAFSRLASIWDWVDTLRNCSFVREFGLGECGARGMGWG